VAWPSLWPVVCRTMTSLRERLLIEAEEGQEDGRGAGLEAAPDESYDPDIDQRPAARTSKNIGGGVLAARKQYRRAVLQRSSTCPLGDILDIADGLSSKDTRDRATKERPPSACPPSITEIRFVEIEYTQKAR